MSETFVDAQTSRSLYAANADRVRPPASLTKMMTLLLVFDALNAGRLRPNDTVTMTAAGARQKPTRLGLARGKTMSVQSAIRAVAVISANDVAVAVAGKLDGDEATFVERMNRRASQLGMSKPWLRRQARR